MQIIHFMNYFQLFVLDLMSTIAVSYVQYLKEQLEVLHQLLLSKDHLPFSINNEDEKLCSHKYVQ